MEKEAKETLGEKNEKTWNELLQNCVNLLQKMKECAFKFEKMQLEMEVEGYVVSMALANYNLIAKNHTV